MVWTVNRTTKSLFFQLTALNLFYLKCITWVQDSFSVPVNENLCLCVHRCTVWERKSVGVEGSMISAPSEAIPSTSWPGQLWGMSNAQICYARSRLKVQTFLSQLQFLASSLFSVEQTNLHWAYSVLELTRHCSLSAGNGVLLMGSRSTSSLPLGYFLLACISEKVVAVERASCSCTLSPFI